MGIRDKIDPVLRDLIGDARDEIFTDDQPRDPVADFIFRQTHGIDAPGAVTSPRTLPEIEKALDAVRQELGFRGNFSERLAKFPLDVMAASSAEYLGEDAPVTKFLQAATRKDDPAMRAAIREMVDGPPVQ